MYVYIKWLGGLHLSLTIMISTDQMKQFFKTKINRLGIFFLEEDPQRKFQTKDETIKEHIVGSDYWSGSD